MADPAFPMPTAVHVMAKPVGPVCNLACQYCYYLEKQNLYAPAEKWEMPLPVLEQYVRQYIVAQKGPEVEFAWQGGEPMLRGLDFFRDAVRLQKQYAAGKRIANVLQTNGTLLDEQWCVFLKEHRFLVGLSIDGPRQLHDAYRIDRQHKSTFDRVMRGLELLRKHAIDFCTLTVVNRLNSQAPLEVYQFLQQAGSTFMQFIPLVERLPDPSAASRCLALAEPPVLNAPAAMNTPVTQWSVLPEQYGRFLVTIFDHWVRHDVGRTSVQLFEVALGRWLGMGPGLCYFAPTCGGALLLEHNGDVYSCDHFVYPQYRLGNLTQQSLADLAGCQQQRCFGQSRLDLLSRYCRACPVFPACNGDCPKHRFVTTPDGQPGLSYLCPALKLFFTHTQPYLKAMAQLIRSGRPATLIMRTVQNQDQLQPVNELEAKAGGGPRSCSPS